MSKRNKKEVRALIAVGEEEIPMRRVLEFRYQNERYGAFTPAGEEEEDAGVLICRETGGQYLPVSGETADELYEVFCAEYDKKERGELSTTEYLRLNRIQKMLYCRSSDARSSAVKQKRLLIPKPPTIWSIKQTPLRREY